MREHPHNLPILRFLSKLIIKEGPSNSASLVLENLKKCYTTVDDLRLMYRLQELRLSPETQAKLDTPSPTEPVSPTNESSTEQIAE